MPVKLKYVPSKLTLRQLEIYEPIYPKSIKLLRKNTKKQLEIVKAIQRYENDIPNKYHNDKDFYKSLKADSDITGSKRRKTTKRTKRTKRGKKSKTTKRSKKRSR